MLHVACTGQPGNIHHFHGAGHAIDTLYCGRSVLDGRPCGPFDGPQCAECVAFQASQVVVDKWTSGQMVILAPGYQQNAETIGNRLLHSPALDQTARTFTFSGKVLGRSDLHEFKFLIVAGGALSPGQLGAVVREEASGYLLVRLHPAGKVLSRYAAAHGMLQ
jgi:hypothetical protein